MKKEFIPYEQALALKELGFDEDCFKYYTEEFKLGSTGLYYAYDNPIDFLCLAPLYQQSFRWFREAYSLLNHLTTHLNPYGEDGALEESYGYRIMFNKDGWKCDVWEELIFDTHEEAELACLAKLIEIAKEQKQKKTSV